jgi:recombination protein RecR
MKELKSLNKLTDSFAQLPSVGRKSAERMARAVLEMDMDDAKDFSSAIIEIKNKIHRCPICGLYTEDAECEVCSSDKRNHDIMIVVSYQKDAEAFEKLDNFNGVYHVLNGVLSAVKGVGVDDLNIDALLKRVEKEHTKELILATNPTIEGETTALYIAKLLENKEINITRLAYGLPMGGQLDYADALTLNKALEGRKKL